MTQYDLEVSVNYAFTEMLQSLEKQGLFGKDDETCRAAFSAIALELSKRQIVYGFSCGANSVDSVSKAS